MQDTPLKASDPGAIQTLSPPPPSPAELSRRSQRLLIRLNRLDFACYEGMALKEAVGHIVAGPLNELEHALTSAHELLEMMALLTGVSPLPQLHNALCGQPVPVTLSAPLSEGHPPGVHPDASALLEIELEHAGLLTRGLTGLMAAGQREALGRLLTLATAQLCAATLALRAMHDEPSRWGLIGACEEARRQLRHVVRLSATASLRVTEPAQIPEMLVGAGPTCLGEALEARELLLSWRSDVLPQAEAALHLRGDALALELRDLRTKLTELFAQPSYPLLRMADRYCLRNLERRLSGWLDKPWTAFEMAEGLLRELMRSTDELLRINDRMLLVQHDCRVQAEVLGVLHTLAEQRAKAPEPDAAAPSATSAPVASKRARAGGAKSKPNALHKVATMLWQVRWRSSELAMFLGANGEEMAAPRPSTAFVQRLMDVVEHALVS